MKRQNAFFSDVSFQDVGVFTIAARRVSLDLLQHAVRCGGSAVGADHHQRVSQQRAYVFFLNVIEKSTHVAFLFNYQVKISVKGIHPSHLCDLFDAFAYQMLIFLTMKQEYPVPATVFYESNVAWSGMLVFQYFFFDFFTASGVF